MMNEAVPVPPRMTLKISSAPGGVSVFTHWHTGWVPGPRSTTIGLVTGTCSPLQLIAVVAHTPWFGLLGEVSVIVYGPAVRLVAPEETGTPACVVVMDRVTAARPSGAISVAEGPGAAEGDLLERQGGWGYSLVGVGAAHGVARGEADAWPGCPRVVMVDVPAAVVQVRSFSRQPGEAVSVSDHDGWSPALVSARRKRDARRRAVGHLEERNAPLGSYETLPPMTNDSLASGAPRACAR